MNFWETAVMRKRGAEGPQTTRIMHQGLEVHLRGGPRRVSERTCRGSVVRKGRKPRAESIHEAPGGLTKCLIRRLCDREMLARLCAPS